MLPGVPGVVPLSDARTARRIADLAHAPEARYV